MKRFFFNEMESLTGVGFAVVMALNLIAVTAGLWTLDRWNEQAFGLITKVADNAEYTHRMRNAIRLRELSVQRMISSRDRFERDDEYVRFLSYAADYADAREKLESMETSGEIREHFQRVQDAINYTQSFHEQLTEALIHGNLPDADVQNIAREGARAMQKVVVLLDRLVDLQRSHYTQVVSDYQQARQRILFGTIAIYIISLLVSLAVVRKSGDRFKYVSRLTIIDETTGAYNRRYFDMVLEEEWKRSMREYTPLSMIMVDIDYFKAYNDKFGHQMGDVCLYSVTRIIGGQLKRASDFIARYGGEEFAIVLPNTNAENARLLGERLRRSVEDARIQAGNESVSPWVTISVGVVTTTAEFNQPSSVLIRAADKAMYRSKESGRNRVTEVNLADL
jgi:diguanylate cyclase (GGDEF)-like protein